MSKKPVISVKNYSHSFGNYKVIKDLSFEVFKGDIFGFLGANGSGKTTTIRTLLGIYKPSSGELTINGKSFSPSSGITLGYLPEERGLYKKESVIDTMTYFGQLKNLSRQDARKWSLNYLDRVELGDKANVRLDKLSGGQQQKVQLGVTIMNQPELLILDEPTKGFDPVNRRLMMDIIQESQQNGSTVILVTHQMEEVERFCNRIILLKNGTQRLYGDIDSIKNEYGVSTISLIFKGSLPGNAKMYTITKQTPTTAELAVSEKSNAQAVLSYLVNQPKLELLKFEIGKVSLDDIFVQIYQENEAK